MLMMVPDTKSYDMSHCCVFNNFWTSNKQYKTLATVFMRFVESKIYGISPDLFINTQFES